MTDFIENLKDLQTLGYTHVASVIKQVFDTEYFNLRSIDELLAEGKWIGAEKCHGKYVRGIGLSRKEVDELTTKWVRKSRVSYIVSNRIAVK